MAHETRTRSKTSVSEISTNPGGNYEHSEAEGSNSFTNWQSRPGFECGGYTAVTALGSGSYGEVWCGVHENRNCEVAMKLSGNSTLRAEAEILQALSNSEKQVAKYVHFEQIGSTYCLIMEKLGETICDYLSRAQGAGFGVQNAAQIGMQIVERLQYLHSRGFIHRDIKPNNFLFGLGDLEGQIYISDFGLSKTYWKPGKFGRGRHIPFTTGKKVGGTLRYISENTHHGYEQSRRDDLESAGYLILHMFCGTLPWMKSNEKFSAKRIGKMKMDLLAEAAISAIAPSEIAEYLACCKKLRFEERPDYFKLLEVLSSLSGPSVKNTSLRQSPVTRLRGRTTFVQPDDSAAVRIRSWLPRLQPRLFKRQRPADGSSKDSNRVQPTESFAAIVCQSGAEPHRCTSLPAAITVAFVSSRKDFEMD